MSIGYQKLSQLRVKFNSTQIFTFYEVVLGLCGPVVADNSITVDWWSADQSSFLETAQFLFWNCFSGWWINNSKQQFQLHGQRYYAVPLSMPEFRAYQPIQWLNWGCSILNLLISSYLSVQSHSEFKNLKKSKKDQQTKNWLIFGSWSLHYLGPSAFCHSLQQISQCCSRK